MLKKYSNISTDKTHKRTQNPIQYLWVVSFPHQLKREREVNTSMSANYICTYFVKILSRAHAYKVSPHNIRQQPGHILSLQVLSLMVKMDFSVFIYCNLDSAVTQNSAFISHLFIWKNVTCHGGKKQCKQKTEVWNKAKCWLGGNTQHTATGSSPHLIPSHSFANRQTEQEHLLSQCAALSLKVSMEAWTLQPAYIPT